MAYKKIYFSNTKGLRLYLFLMKELGFSQKLSQKTIAKNRVYINDIPINSPTAIISEEFYLFVYDPCDTLLNPIFHTKNFALFDKPHGMLSHPKNRNSKDTLIDAAKNSFGVSANIVHRLDRDTSGIVIVSKDLQTEIKFKSMFEEKLISKSYLAVAFGNISQEIICDMPILKNLDYSNTKHKAIISENGKESKTVFKPIKYYEKLNATLVEAIPKTGRLHQIRVHLNHLGHPILGDTIYGLSFGEASFILDNRLNNKEIFKLTKAHRLMLHANSIEFDFENISYKLFSKMNFLDEIEKLIKLKEEFEN